MLKLSITAALAALMLSPAEAQVVGCKRTGCEMKSGQQMVRQPNGTVTYISTQTDTKKKRK
jgi:formylglycine-generating enzyme required for sulfatase activity